MNERILPLLIFSTAFLVAIASVVSIPQDAWSLMPSYESATIAFSLLTGLAAILLAYWVHADHKDVEWARAQSNSVTRTVEKLGAIVDDNFDIVFKRLEKIEETRKDLDSDKS